jgi:hypothetical protein
MEIRVYPFWTKTIKNLMCGFDGLMVNGCRCQSTRQLTIFILSAQGHGIVSETKKRI